MSDNCQGFKYSTPAYILDKDCPDDVARAMINSGRQTQAFYLFNMDEAHCRMQYFKKMMPRVNIFYAMKSNDTDEMVRLAVALGLGFDCSSPGEIYKVMKLGVHSSKIIFALPCKSPDEMNYARNMGVQYTTFDSLCELQKTKEFWPDAKLLIRIRVDGDALIKLGMKFGCDFDTEAIDLLDQAASFGLKVAGVAFHVGSLCYSPESYVTGLQQARALFDHEAANGRRMYIVDIGGGFLSDRTDSINKTSSLVNDALSELFPDQNVQIFSEPGGYLCDSAFKMFCRVVGTREAIMDNNQVTMLYLNNGAHGTFKFDENWHVVKKYQLQRLSEEEPLVEDDVILWGPTCDSLDCVVQNYRVKLPRCVTNDWLVVEIHGAYTLSLVTKFSSIERPPIRSVLSKELWNSIKSSSVYQPSDFIQVSDISAPLPTTLPPLLSTCQIYEHSEILS